MDNVKLLLNRNTFGLLELFQKTIEELNKTLKETNKQLEELVKLRRL